MDRMDLALYLSQQALAIFGALCVVPTNVRILNDLHLLPHFVPSSLDQHLAQASRVLPAQKAVQIEVEKSTVGQVVRCCMRTKT